MGRKPCCEKDEVKKGPWPPEEDQKLIDYIEKHGPGNWRTLPKQAGLQRCGKSCRLRWANYLRPDIKRGRFSSEEEETIIHLHSILGNKWSAIAAKLPGRTDNEIKNYWNTHIRKKLLRMGIDPVTHRPRLDLHDLSSILSSLQTINSSFPNFQTLLNYPQLLSFGNPIMGNTVLPYPMQPSIQNTQFMSITQILEQNPSRNNTNFEVKSEEKFENFSIPNHVTHCPLSTTSSDYSAFLSNASGSNSLSSLFSTPCSSSLDRLDSGLAYLISCVGSEDDIESYFGDMVKKFENPSTLDVCTS